MNEQYNSQFQKLLKDLDIQQKKQMSLRSFSLILLVLLVLSSLLITYPIDIF